MRHLASIAFSIAFGVLGATTPVSADDRIPAEGEFTAEVDFSTLSLTPWVCLSS